VTHRPRKSRRPPNRRTQHAEVARQDRGTGLVKFALFWLRLFYGPGISQSVAVTGTYQDRSREMTRKARRISRLASSARHHWWDGDLSTAIRTGSIGVFSAPARFVAAHTVAHCSGSAVGATVVNAMAACTAERQPPQYSCAVPTAASGDRSRQAGPLGLPAHLAATALSSSRDGSGPPVGQDAPSIIEAPEPPRCSAPAASAIWIHQLATESG